MISNRCALNLASFFIIYFLVTGCANSRVPPSPCVSSASDTINVPMIVRPLTDGTLLLRAEYGRPIGPKIKYMPKLRVYGYFTAADAVEWDVEVGQDAMYDVYMEWAISDEEAGKEFLFEAGEEQVKGTIASTGSFYTHKTEKIGSMQVEKGKQKMAFKAASNFEKGELVDLRGIWLQLSKK